MSFDDLVETLMSDPDAVEFMEYCSVERRKFPVGIIGLGRREQQQLLPFDEPSPTMSHAAQRALFYAVRNAKEHGRNLASGADVIYVLLSGNSRNKTVDILRNYIDKNLAIDFIKNHGADPTAQQRQIDQYDALELQADINQLKRFVATQQSSFMTARDGRVDLADTRSDASEVEPRKLAASRAAADLLSLCRRGNLQHGALVDFTERYISNLNQMPTSLPAIVWFVEAQKIENYRANYMATSTKQPGEYPPLEPELSTAIDAVVLATGILARLFPDIAKSQDDFEKYAGRQVSVRKATRDLLDRALSDLAASTNVLTPRARELTKEIAELNVGSASPESAEASRTIATKAGLIRSFLDSVANLAHEQIIYLQENIRTKAAYDISKVITKGLMVSGFGALLDYLHFCSPVIHSLAEAWPSMFKFTKSLLRLLGVAI